MKYYILLHVMSFFCIIMKYWNIKYWLSLNNSAQKLDFTNTKNIFKKMYTACCEQLMSYVVSAVRSADPRNSVIQWLYICSWEGCEKRLDPGSWKFDPDAVLYVLINAVVLTMCGSYWDLGSRKFMFISAWKRFEISFWNWKMGDTLILCF